MWLASFPGHYDRSHAVLLTRTCEASWQMGGYNLLFLMAERSQYNERYSFQDLSRAASRSTRYRARKRAKDDQSLGGDSDIHTVSEIEGESEQLEECATRVSEASTPYHEGIPDDSCDQPHVLECEILGNDEYHVGVSDSDEENEQSGPGCGASSSTCTLPVSTDDRPL